MLMCVEVRGGQVVDSWPVSSWSIPPPPGARMGSCFVVRPAKRPPPIPLVVHRVLLLGGPTLSIRTWREVWRAVGLVAPFARGDIIRTKPQHSIKDGIVIRVDLEHKTALVHECYGVYNGWADAPREIRWKHLARVQKPQNVEYNWTDMQWARALLFEAPFPSCGPRHRRSILHLAAMTCSFDRFRAVWIRLEFWPAVSVLEVALKNQDQRLFEYAWVMLWMTKDDAKYWLTQALTHDCSWAQRYILRDVSNSRLQRAVSRLPDCLRVKYDQQVTTSKKYSGACLQWDPTLFD